MKFLATKELKDNSFLRYLLYGLLGFSILFLILDLVIHHLQIGLLFTDALATVLGDEEAFIEPILIESLLLTIHIDLFFSMLLLLILASIYIRVSKENQPPKILLHGLFLSALLAPIFLLIGYFTGAFGVFAWVVLFIIWHLLALTISFKSLYLVYKL